MKKFVKPALPVVTQTGNRAGTRFTSWARSCVRLVSILSASAVIGLTTHAATQLFTGAIKREVWSGAPNRQAVYNGTVGTPNIVTYPTTFEAPWDVADNYSMRLSGYFVPPTTGLYYFIVSSDDDSDLWLSTDSNPANKRMIGQQPGWNSNRNWPGDDGSDTASEPQKNSQTFSAADGTKPFAAGIQLTAGTPYYMEAVMHEGGGGDNLGVTAQLVGTPIPALGEDAAIVAEQIGLIFIVPTTFSVAVTPNNPTAAIGTSAHFTANVTTDTDDTVTYQWRTNGVNVTGATGKNFSTSILSASDTGLKIDVVAGLAHFNNTATSAQSTVTVPATPATVVNGYLKGEYFAGSASRADIYNGNVGAPTWTRNLTSFESPTDFADNYSFRISGYFIPATTGTYHFIVSSDDDSDFWISTDASPANKRLVAQQPGWNANRVWENDPDAAGGPTNPQRISDTWVPDPLAPPPTPPYAAGFQLTAGTRYYIEGLVHEGGGGDNFAVSFWTDTGTPTTPPVNGSGSALTGSLIAYATATPTTLTITTQPHNATVTEGFGTNFTVVVSTDAEVQPVYQWMRNGVDIAGATGPSYGLTPVAADNGATYTVKVTVPGTTLTATSTAATLTVQTPVLAAGFLKYEAFYGDSRAAVENGTAGPPDVLSTVSSFESPTNIREDFSTRISGFFIPATTEDYVFFLAADDDTDLFLSTDASPANKKLIAQEAGWSGVRSWNTVGGGSTIENKRSDSFTASQWVDSIPDDGVTTIRLTAGTRYYIEAVAHEGGGGDNLAVTVVTAEQAAGGVPANGEAPTLTGPVIGFLVPSSTITIGTQPASRTIDEGTTATFTVAATTDSMFGNSSLSYQWQRNGVDIPGATSASYTTPVQALANNNDKYTVVIKGPGATTTTSAQATLTVTPDTTPPVFLTAGSVKRGTTFEIGLGFNEPLDATTAGNPANYTLSKGTVTAVRVQPYATPIDGAAPVVVKGDVVLVTSGLAAGDSVIVTAKNVTDVKGNAMSATGTSQTAPVTGKMSWVAIGGNDFQEGVLPGTWTDFPQDAAKFYDDAVALKTDTDFDLISGSSANWNNYDEATFAYEEITGDFDRVVRLEYQDPSSQWARAGILARTALDEGVTRAQATDPAGTPMGANISVRVNPAVQWNGTVGNNAYEFVYRDTIGGNYANSGGGSTPAYPNAWMRLQRVGQLISAFRSVDGTTWINIGTRDYAAIQVDPNAAEPGFPAKLYVGPYFAPELVNNDSFRIGHSVVAKFRDYKPFPTGGGEPNINAVTLAGGNVTITWTGAGTLEWTSALAPGGTWTSTNDSDGSYSEAVGTAGAKFFRVRQ